MYAAISKLIDFETFAVQLAQSPLLSAYAGFIAWLVPGIEIIIAFFLMFGKYRTLALYASFTLMVMFTNYIWIILNYSDFIPCSCGGVLEKMSWMQHLIFNLVFILLAALGIFIGQKKIRQRKLLLLSLLAVFGIGIVVLFFVFSEKKMHQNNAFIRRHLPHFANKIKSHDLGYSSYYFAGIESDIVYLGNSTAPLLLTAMDTALTGTSVMKVQIDNMGLPFRRVRIEVSRNQFFVFDGIVPIIFKGSIHNWKANTFIYKPYYFSQAIILDGNSLAVCSQSSEDKKNMLGILSRDSVFRPIYNPLLLRSENDGVFDTDGQLLWNNSLKKLIYMYYYRNKFLVVDENLELIYQGKTIDTVNQVSLDITNLKRSGKKKLNPNTITINNNAATDKNLLFIQTDRLGKFESNRILEEAEIIDVYDIDKKTYVFSFYLYRPSNLHMRSFMVRDLKLYALMGSKLISYKLDTKMLEYNSNE
nr:DoxX family protein [Aequorivita antarctica]